MTDKEFCESIAQLWADHGSETAVFLAQSGELMRLFSYYPQMPGVLSNEVPEGVIAIGEGHREEEDNGPMSAM